MELTKLLEIDRQAAMLRIQIAAALRKNQRSTALKCTKTLCRLVADPWADTLYRFLIETKRPRNASQCNE
jgi:hypothetical protein